MGEQDIAGAFAALGCAQLYDAAPGVVRVVGPEVTTRTPGLRLAGPAFPVRSDNDVLPVLQALHGAPAGSVIVVENTAERHVALAGDLIGAACRVQAIAGLVIDGAVRDIGELAEIGLPTFSRSVTFVATKRTETAADPVPGPAQVGEAEIHPEDWVFGDDDGLLVVPAAEVRAVLAAAAQLEDAERRLKDRIRDGALLTEVIGLPGFLAGEGPITFSV
jgi:regulator of RNase E activity RraA